MSKISLPFCLLTLFLLAMNVEFVAGGAGGICREGLGMCGTDCDARCKGRHNPEENPQGSCETVTNMRLCYCLYSCGGSPPGPPAGKVCYDGLGLCSGRCNDDCCNAKCASRHRGGQGFCDNNIGLYLCHCSYPC